MWSIENDMEDEEEGRAYYALSSDDYTTLKHLLQYEDLSPNYRFEGSNQLGRYALHLACEKGHYDCAKMLLDKGANTGVQDKWYQTPLMYCVCTERVEMVQLLISYHCDTDIQDKFGKTALHYCVNNTETACMKALIAAGAYLDSRDEVGRTPLWFCIAEDGNMEPLTLLIAAGASVNIGDVRERRTPLHACLFRPHKDTIPYLEQLLASGADPNIKDIMCHNPLMSLIKRGMKYGGYVDPQHQQIASLLISAGTDLDTLATTKYWYQYSGTALKLATERGALVYVDMLLTAGADPDLCDSRGVTPFLLACEKNFIAIGRRLMQSNCELNLRGQLRMNGKWVLTSPFECCVMRENWELAEMMVLAGYDLRQEGYLLTNEQVPQTLLLNFSFWSWLHQNLTSPQTLGFICRRYIRCRLGRQLPGKVREMRLPAGLCDLLLMKDVFPQYCGQ